MQQGKTVDLTQIEQEKIFGTLMAERAQIILNLHADMMKLRTENNDLRVRIEELEDQLCDRLEDKPDPTKEPPTKSKK